MPFIPTSPATAGAMLACTFVAWGHWPIFQRLSSRSAPAQTFFCALVLYQTCCTLLICAVAGNIQGPFIGALLADVAAAPLAMAVAAFGGASLAGGEFLTTVAIEELGVAVGAPMIWSLAMVGGIGGDYLLDGSARPAEMLAGIGLGLAAFVCDSQSHHNASAGAPAADALSLATGTPASEPAEKPLGAPTSRRSSAAGFLPPAATVVELPDKCADEAPVGTPTPAPDTKVADTGTAGAPIGCWRRLTRVNRKLGLAVAGGIGLALWTTLSTLSGHLYPLSPYSLALSFQLGEAAATVPIVLTYSALEQAPLAPRTPAQLARGLRQYSLRGHACACASGVCIAIGYWLYFITRGLIARPVAYGIVQSCGVVSMVWGAAVFGEYRAAPPQKKVLLAAALFLYPAAVTMMALSV